MKPFVLAVSSRRLCRTAGLAVLVMVGAVAAIGSMALDDGTTKTVDVSASPSTPVASPPSSDPALDTALRLQDVFAAIAERVTPSVVSVTALVRQDGPADAPMPGGWMRAANDADYPGYRPVAAGSGFILDDAGLVLTCRSNLLRGDGELADLIDVETHDRRHTISSLVGVEPTLNLAILRLEVYAKETPPSFVAATWGDSAAMRVGHWAIGMGDPPGPERFLQPGVVAALPFRDCYQEQLSATYLQTSLSVHAQAHGGPLVNIRGEVVGILQPRPASPVAAATAGLELALPSTILRAIVPSIVENGSVRSPWLGFAVMSRDELREQLGTPAFLQLSRPQTGIFIESVFDPSPALAAGVRPGDFLVRLDEHPIHAPVEFQRWLYLAGVGRSVEVEFFRDGQSFTRTVTIEERPQAARPR